MNGDRQQQLLNFLLSYHARNGYAPSIREMVDGVGISSTSVVAYNLKKLAKDGHIRLGEKGESRAIDLRPAIRQRMAARRAQEAAQPA